MKILTIITSSPSRVLPLLSDYSAKGYKIYSRAVTRGIWRFEVRECAK